MSYNTVQIIDIKDDKLQFNKNNLKTIVNKAKNDKLAVLTINGALRSGKSFFLNMFLKILFPKKQFTSFNWTHGKDIGTYGMWALDSPININDEFSLIIIDTQGIYDTTLGVKLTTGLFALSTLISSFQIYNIDKRLQEDYLHHLEFFSEYANIANEMTGLSTPFQHLSLLIRDWQFFTKDKRSDMSESEQYLTDFFSDNKKTKDMIQTRNNIKKCFKTISCALLPHPGFEVSEGSFINDLGSIRDSFIGNINEYAEYIMSTIEPKKIFERRIKPEELPEYMEKYIDILNNKMPEPDTLLNTQIKLEHSFIVSEIISDYNQKMNKVILDKLSDRDLKLYHDKTKESLILKSFDKAVWGSDDSRKRIIEDIEKRLDDIFSQYDKLNRIQKSWNLGRYAIFGLLFLLKWQIAGYCSVWLCTTLNVFSTVAIAGYFGYYVISSLKTIGIDIVKLGKEFERRFIY